MFTSLEIRAAVGIALVVAALIGKSVYDDHEQKIGALQSKADAAEASLKLAQANAAKSAQIVATQQGVIHDAQLQASAASAAAARAASERNAFRVRLAAYVSASRGPVYPAAASGGETAGDPLGVLADVLGRADDRAQVLASYADQARIAGLACERSYDALTAPAPQLPASSP